ncbi:hypothetical protein RJ640_006286 [Escallonia rubra]|uniref:Protein kinase domain-containing protein n=1 Tax=Escallonia rubra TaxID=112253 RepID=A0AA88UJH6_9ASTE|nr:hypothetical protein RJ640_006286 [Escallonia rubra]
MMASCIPFSSLKERYAKVPPRTLKAFKYTELEKATLNFHRSNKIGEHVYKGVISMIWEDDHRKVDVAIKKLSGMQAKKCREWVRDVISLNEIEHPNLIKLIGYCAKDNKKDPHFGCRFLVYEFMKNGSVRDHLSDHASFEPLGWEMRVKIARDAARALAYLHGKHIVYKLFKSSVVLLDNQCNVKLADYIISRLGPFPSPAMERNGSMHEAFAVAEFEMEEEINCDLHEFSAYGPPEFFDHYKLRAENDVWSFGIFLCELLTGSDPSNNNRLRHEIPYVNWVEQHFSSATRLREIIDPRLRGKYVLESAQELAMIAKTCLRKEPNFRPSMRKVAAMMHGISSA